jgi:uncharacterized membrane protein
LHSSKAWDPADEEVVAVPVDRNGPSLFWPGVLVGIGVAGTLDEVVLHQLLAWHHFYDRSTPTVGLVSDGTIQHKLLRLHQVREGAPDNLPYDLAFLAIAAAVALAGALLLRQVHQLTP